MNENEFASMIEGELRKIESAAETARSIDLNDRVEVNRAALAMYLHNIYSGVERVLLRFLKFYRIPVPTGREWHLELIELFYEPGRPPLPLLFTSSMQTQIHLLRGLRHVILNNYAADLDPGRLSEHVLGFNVWLDSWAKLVRHAIPAHGDAG